MDWGDWVTDDEARRMAWLEAENASLRRALRGLGEAAISASRDRSEERLQSVPVARIESGI